jgi:hypothetical protein
MNILDENTREDQVAILRRKRVPVKKIGEEIGRKGMKDKEIIPLLHELNRPTFFTLDADFYQLRLRHEGYCLVYLDIEDIDFATFVLRVLRHPSLNTKAKRMGLVARVEPEGLTLWRIPQNKPEHLAWK